VRADRDERGSVEDRSAGCHAAVSFFDQPAGVIPFKMVHAMAAAADEGASRGGPVAVVLARTDDAVVG
jgi:hypothetical protein